MQEKIDEHSGAILFKKDEETIRYEKLSERVDKLEEIVKKLKKDIKNKEV